VTERNDPALIPEVSIETRSHQLVDRTRRLVEFLLETVRANSKTIKHLDQYKDQETYLYLSEMPESSVRSLRIDANPGELLFSVAKVVFLPPPDPGAGLVDLLDLAEISDSGHPGPQIRDEVPADARTASVLAAYSRWIAEWHEWAADDQERRYQSSWYEQLAKSVRDLEQKDDEYELVLGAGMMSWDADEADVFHPLMTTRLMATMNQTTARVDVFLASTAIIRLGDRSILRDIDGYAPNRAQDVRTELRDPALTPLSPKIHDIYQSWQTLSLEVAQPYSESWDAPEPGSHVAQVTFAPMVLFRKRDMAALIEFYESMEVGLAAPGAIAPLGLAQLLESIETPERIAWLEEEDAVPGAILGDDPLFPLPANVEQRTIIERLRHDNGVVVQGPPGTGKTHTIANLLTALLARGQRVLVTSQKSQALRVLRDKLPPEVQGLCVSMTDLGRGGSDELNSGINALADRHATFDAGTEEQRIDRLEAERRAIREEAAELKEKLRSLRETETYVHPEVAPGFQGTKATIADKIKRLEDSLGWMPVPLPPGAPDTPPLSTAEFAELLGLLQSATPEREARSAQVLIDIDELPLPAATEQMVADEAALTEAAASLESSPLAPLRREVLDEFDLQFRAATALLLNLGMSLNHEEWEWEWRAGIIFDAISGKDQSAWRQLQTHQPTALWIQTVLGQVGLTEIALPAFEPAGPNSMVAQVAAAKEVQQQLAQGKTLRRKMRPQQQKTAAMILDEVRVDGRFVFDHPEWLQLVIPYLDALVSLEGLRKQWQSFGVGVTPATQPAIQLSELLELFRHLDIALGMQQIRAIVSQLLQSNGLQLPLTTPVHWAEVQRAHDVANGVNRAKVATEQLEATVAALEAAALRIGAAPEISGLRLAVVNRDGDLYRSIFEVYQQASTQKQVQSRCDELFARLDATHPALAHKIVETRHDGEWPTRIAMMADAWAWAWAFTFIERQRTPGLDDQVSQQLRANTARVLQATAELAAARAWAKALSRMSTHEVNALRNYRQNVASYGAGTGKWAQRFKAAAKSAMYEARSAVPAWVMPISEVVSTVPAERNTFDVVIVDEASQAGIDSLFLMWLAPRIIVVGDDRQCAPGEIHRGGNQQVYDRLDEFLYDVPDWMRLRFSPKSNLFSLLGTQFSSTIRLREHFRCMPEIITWSSRQFYSDEPLVPLRQYGADRLPPIQVRYVSGAVQEGKATTLVNHREAAAIVEQIRRCCEDPAYDGKSMGVVVLQGAAQAALIDTLLQIEVPAEEIEKRRIRVGTAPDFQGDERNIIFLSMVVAERPSKVTALDWQRRFNVAASRAEDQLWLFHSVTLDLLRPDDLRRSLLAYMLNPPAPMSRGVYSELTWDSEVIPPFDSKFEQRVYIELRDRGYSVTPQYEINGRFIDLFVSGAKGQLAVECDGDYWHSRPEDVAADLDRELELERAGVKFWRVRESEFYLDRQGSLASLWTTLEQRGIRPGDLNVHGGDGSGDASGEDWTPEPLSDVEGLDGLDDGDPRELDDRATVSKPHTPRTQRRLKVASIPSLAADTGDGHDTLFSEPSERLTLTIPGIDSSGPTASEVREWARREGLEVGERGRLHPDVIAYWNAEFPDSPYRPRE
jgi:very-short-patch-repair endonuclease